MSNATRTKAINALKNHKAEQEEQLHNNIVAALVRINNNETLKVSLKAFKKVSVQDLATEAGVSRGALYGNHKALLEKLEKINSKRTTGVTSIRHKQEQKVQNDAENLKHLAADKEMLAQENYRLQNEIKLLQARNEALLAQLGSSTNVTPINQ
jgi:AcrR family transcriptional regulator